MGARYRPPPPPAFSAPGFEPRERTVATPTALGARLPTLRPVPRAGTAAATTAGVSPAPARQLPGWRHGPARPRLRPSLSPAPTCAEFVYLAAMATRGGPREGGEKKGGAGPGGGPLRSAGRRRGRAGAEKL